MTPRLRTKIDELIDLDNQRENENAARPSSNLGIAVGSPECDALVDDILYGEKAPVLVALEKLSTDELIYVMALMLFGRGDGIAEQGATFEFVLNYARNNFDNGSPGYIYEKPLGKYLSRGLKRLGIS